MRAATTPAPDARLYVVDETGQARHRRRAELLDVIEPGDIVVANDAATIPASLAGTHLPTGRPIEIRLAGRDSLSPLDITEVVAVVFGDGDFRTPTEHRPLPPPVQPGDRLRVGTLQAVVLRTLGHSRLVRLRFEGMPAWIWKRLARYGRPIQYAHLPDPLNLWDVWTPIAAQPVAFEPPSAGFALTWQLVAGLIRKGVHFATLTHAAGISSTGDADLDARLPFDEAYRIPAATAAAVNRACAEERRVVAIGTSVVRALEDAGRDGPVRAGEGTATGVLGPASRLRVVDAVLSGTHEPGTSHYALLQAFAPDDVLTRMSDELDAGGYRTHEFGDSIFVSRRRLEVRRRASIGSMRTARLTGR